MAQETVLILANGTWNVPQRLHATAEEAALVIAADGGWSKAQRLGLRADLVVGDLDSLSPDERAQLEASGIPIEAFPADKDWTDLELAITRALSRHPSRIVLFGVSGSRLDHTLAAVFLLEMGYSKGVPIEIWDGDETLRLLAGPYEICEAEPGDRVSLLPVTETVRISTSGLRFPLRDELLYRTASRGVSNEVIGSPVRVDVADGRVLLLHASQVRRVGA